jgi:predicted DNA-binding protein with PD1-like motif
MNAVSTRGLPVYHCLRLHRGDDLLASIRALAQEKNIAAGVVLSAVGCVLKYRLRDASGVNIRENAGHYEIVSLTGTVSRERCHLHISLSGEDLATLGGHLCEGCTVNTTCELVILELPGITIQKEFDPETGYDELIFQKEKDYAAQ